MTAAYDAAIARIAGRKPLQSVADVLTIMQELDRVLRDGDGVKWFNLLYLRVTEGIRDESATATWRDAQWLETLDVVFAELYFDALVHWAQDHKSAARCWRALFESRTRTDVARIQFALAGMNAHINHDLVLALLRTSEDRKAMPERGSAQHVDFERVNGLLERVEEKVKAFLLSTQVQVLDRHFGRVDDVIALWKVRMARDTAWANGEVGWEIRRVSIAARQFIENLDRLVSLSSKGLLVPTELRI